MNVARDVDIQTDDPYLIKCLMMLEQPVRKTISKVKLFLGTTLGLITVAGGVAAFMYWDKVVHFAKPFVKAASTYF